MPKYVVTRVEPWVLTFVIEADSEEEAIGRASVLGDDEADHASWGEDCTYSADKQEKTGEVEETTPAERFAQVIGGTLEGDDLVRDMEGNLHRVL